MSKLRREGGVAGISLLFPRIGTAFPSEAVYPPPERHNPPVYRSFTVIWARVQGARPECCSVKSDFGGKSETESWLGYG